MDAVAENTSPKVTAEVHSDSITRLFLDVSTKFMMLLFMFTCQGVIKSALSLSLLYFVAKANNVVTEGIGTTPLSLVLNFINPSTTFSSHISVAIPN